MRRWLPIVFVLWLGACATGPEVRTDMAAGTDLSRFRTFGFEQRLGEGIEGYSTLTMQRLREAVTREMESRGYVLAASDPDLAVNFSFGAQDRARVVPGTMPYGPWGFRRDLYGTWPSAWPGRWDTVQTFTEETINIDLIDRARRQMVWQGVALSETGDRFGLTSAAQIDANVAAIFARFPARAGGVRTG